MFHNMILFSKFRIKGDNMVEKVKADIYITMEFSILSKVGSK